MKPVKRNQRLALLALGAVALSGAGLLAVTALSENLDYFYTPASIKNGEADLTRRIRLGGLVKAGSLGNGDGVAKIFEVTDGGASITVQYDGILPDLFREGQGVIAIGRFDGDLFIAENILSKHDETYKPRELEGLTEGEPSSYAKP